MGARKKTETKIRDRVAAKKTKLVKGIEPSELFKDMMAKADECSYIIFSQLCYDGTLEEFRQIMQDDDGKYAEMKAEIKKLCMALNDDEDAVDERRVIQSLMDSAANISKAAWAMFRGKGNDADHYKYNSADQTVDEVEFGADKEECDCPLCTGDLTDLNEIGKTIKETLDRLAQ